MSAARPRRSGYDARVARARHIGAAVAVALALGGACRGPGVVSIGTTIFRPETTIYLSPKGDDENCCATGHAPWKTFGKALAYVKPGWTIMLEDGTYDATTTGLLNVVCTAGAPTSSPNAVPAPSGTADNMRITVAAQHPRQAFLAGDGSSPPLTIDACQYWSFEGLHVEAKDSRPADLTTALTTFNGGDFGSVIVVGFGNADVTFDDMLVRHPNRWVQSRLLHIRDASNNVSVTESEFYDFHGNAIEASRTGALQLLRNYVNSRDTPDYPDAAAYHSEAPQIGDYGILLEETSQSLVANNVVEGINDGMALVGRSSTAVVAPNGVTGNIDTNKILGNIVYQPLLFGVRIDSSCWSSDGKTPQNPCADDFHIIKGTVLENDVVIGGDEGISSAGAVMTTFDQITVINAANGVIIRKEPQNVGVMSTSRTTNSLVANFQAVAFDSENETTASFDHCATSGGYTPNSNMEDYVPGGDFVTNALTAPSPLGPCLVYLSSTSPLASAGIGASGIPVAVGANVVYRYEPDGSLSSTPLWTSAGFPCGEPVAVSDADGGAPVVINPDCANVAAQHLNVASMGCASPY